MTYAGNETLQMVIDILRTGRIAEVEFEGEESDNDKSGDSSSGEVLFEEEIDVAGTDMDFLEGKPRKVALSVSGEGRVGRGEDAEEREDGVDVSESSVGDGKGKGRKGGGKGKGGGKSGGKDKKKDKKVHDDDDDVDESESEGQEKDDKKKNKSKNTSGDAMGDDDEHESEVDGQDLNVDKRGRVAADPQDNAFWQDAEANIPLSQADSEELREFDRRMMSANKVCLCVCVCVYIYIYI